MNLALWILQGLLAVAFLGHAYGMLRPNEERLRRGGGMVYVLDLGPRWRLSLGVLEGLAAVAVVAAPLIHSLSWLSPLAAAGLVLLMLGALVFHLRRREYPNLGLNAVLLVLAAIVAWARFGPYHF